MSLQKIRSLFSRSQRPHRWSNRSESASAVQYKVPTCYDRIAHARTIGFDPTIVFDCGAFIGRWTRSISDIFASAKFVMIEPNHLLNEEIRKNTQGMGERAVLVNAAVGRREGQAVLNIWEDPRHKNKTTALAASSLLDHVQGAPHRTLTVRLTTIDRIAGDLGYFPDLLKLDLQGGELDALMGAKRALATCEMCVVEFGCLEAYINRTTPHDLMVIMYESGFCLYDVFDLRYRPYDGALTGGDFAFVKKTSKLKQHKDYF